MATKRIGKYGTYYGSVYSASVSLTTDEMNTNATYIFHYLSQAGWTVNSIAGILGNMQAESSLNPGRWQSDYVGNTSGGYGLVQWTPATNYLNWVKGDASTMDNNLSRILYELENGLQWIATEAYPLSFAEFSQSDKSPAYLASAFLKNYERAGVEVEETRKKNAESWYTFITGLPAWREKRKKKKGYNFVLFNRQKRIRR